MLRAPAFENMGLKVVFFNENTTRAWEANKFAIDVCVETLHVLFEEFVGEKPEETFENAEENDPNNEITTTPTLNEWQSTENASFEAAKQTLLFGVPSCTVCEKQIAFLPENGLFLLTKKDLDAFLASGKAPLIAPCYHCNQIYHLSCLGSVFLDEEDEQEEIRIIPREGQCLGCKKTLSWPKVAKLATRLRGYALQDAVVRLSQT